MRRYVTFLVSILIVIGLSCCSKSRPEFNTGSGETISLSAVCKTSREEVKAETASINSELVDTDGNTVSERFKVPVGYKRVAVDEKSFAGYLHNLPLKEFGSYVKYYDGSLKTNKNVYCSVIDMEIDSADLQQCADAVMRLRGEYLYKQKKYSDIAFNFAVDGKPRYYTEYVDGDFSYNTFRKYMRYIFSYANTASLKQQLQQVDDISKIEVGMVFVQKGNPYGHAVIVLDVAVKNDNGSRIFLLGQSYMPAQETQILVNPMDTSLSPWFEAKKSVLVTPEWIFYPEDLRSF